MRDLQTANKISDQARNSYSLVHTVLSAFRWQFVSTLLPRAAMIGFGYAQTFFIQATIEYLERPQGRRSDTHTRGLTAAAVIIYMGLAVNS